LRSLFTVCLDAIAHRTRPLGAHWERMADERVIDSGKNACPTLGAIEVGVKAVATG